MLTENELLPLSGLQHVVYCERQAALIHVEQVWLDNVWTIEGKHLHEKVTTGEHESRKTVRIARDLAIRSLRLGITGRADVVEFCRISDESAGVVLSGFVGHWRPFPVEYKRGRPKRHRADEIQLCAQALCLEEMFKVPIATGALFYGRTRRRLDVTFDDALRVLTERTAQRFRDLVSGGRTPPAIYEPSKCDDCSLFELCRPKEAGRDVERYMHDSIVELMRRAR